MLIDLRKLLSGTEDKSIVNAYVEGSVLDTGSSKYDIIDKKPFELTFTRTGKNKVSIKGSGSLTLDIPCDRCLKPVKTKVDFEIDQIVTFEGDKGWVEDEEQDYIDGYNLDVDKLVFTEVLLFIPGKTLCKDDCKGLCPVCGADLNIKDCGCDRESLDPRMSVFKDILNNFKEV